MLAGRAINRQFFPLVGAELEYDFDLDDALSTGMLPNVRSEPRHAVDILEAYAQNYIREEVQQEALVKDIGSFARFLDVAALMNGQTLNISNIARDAAVARNTAERYFEILEDTLISVRIPAWKPRARVKEAGSPKFYLFDPGVARTLARQVRLPLTDGERGGLLETLVLNELRAYMNQANTGGMISYWGTPSQSEVDFVWTLGYQAVAIEVKAATRWRSADERHLKSLLDSGHITKAFGVYRGDQELRQGYVWVLPVKSFMQRLQLGEVIG